MTLSQVACVDSRWTGGTLGNAVDFNVAMVRATQAAYLPALRFADRPAAPRERVRIVGYPDRAFLTPITDLTLPSRRYDSLGTVGEVTDRAMTIVPPMFFGGAVGPGSSGSPVLNDAGEVVGIVYAGQFGRTMRAVTVPVATEVCH